MRSEAIILAALAALSWVPGAMAGHGRGAPAFCGRGSDGSFTECRSPSQINTCRNQCNVPVKSGGTLAADGACFCTKEDFVLWHKYHPGAAYVGGEDPTAAK
jgi:hypothetical protein